ncbi:hypothetical protein HZC09_04620 [Candidatus Micrarchaeota archaeon]|nr:hypothetical protein [Candidatus Micrarchaeota archaeon]
MSELELASSILYYLYVALGSITAGYLIIRFTYPEVRLFSSEERLGASALVGLLIAVAAIAADVVFSGTDAVLAAKGSMLNFWLAASVLTFGAMKIGLNREKHAEVAIPVTKKLQTLQNEIEKIEEKPPEKKSELNRKMEELRKKGLIPHATTGEEMAEKIAPKKEAAKAKTQAQAPELRIKQNKEEAKKVLEKARETEVETIIDDLNLKFEKKVQLSALQQRRLERQARKQEESKPKEQLEEEHQERPRRLYMQKWSEAKEEKKEERKEKKKEENKQELPQAPQAGAGEVTMADLFGEAKKSEEVSMVSSENAPSICPNCKAKNSRIVFCPYCGGAMCANCSPSITPSAEGFTYQCPKCGEEILVKKKSA